MKSASGLYDDEHARYRALSPTLETILGAQLKVLCVKGVGSMKGAEPDRTVEHQVVLDKETYTVYIVTQEEKKELGAGSRDITVQSALPLEKMLLQVSPYSFTATFCATHTFAATP